MAVKEAYDTLSDTERRRAYDSDCGLRRLGFFRDVEPDWGGAASEAAARAARGARPGDGGRAVNPWDVHRCAGG
jgi:DnaJ-class molecular chaperone